MDWPSDAWAQAVLLVPRARPGHDASGRLLREGVGHLHFAGEHTCYAFVGYMEGALNSGAALAAPSPQRDGVVK